MVVKIMQIDDEGSISTLAEYTCEPKPALIAYRMQFDRHNWNTWNYPTDMDDIKQTPRGEFAYTKGHNTSVFTWTEQPEVSRIC